MYPLHPLHTHPLKKRHSAVAPTLMAALLSALVAGPVAANSTVAPGLWEQRFSLKSGSAEVTAAMAQMQQQLAAMPPAQRQQMEQMLAAQGISLPSAGGGGPGVQLRFCLTPEQAAKNELPPPDDRCTHSITERTPTLLRMRIECPADKTRGEGEFRFESPRAYAGRFKLQREEAGKPQSLEMELQARWVGADCGNLRPRP